MKHRNTINNLILAKIGLSLREEVNVLFSTKLIYAPQSNRSRLRLPMDGRGLFPIGEVGLFAQNYPLFEENNIEERRHWW